MGIKGEKERGQTARQAATEHTEGGSRSGGQAEGRQEGRREGHGWPCAWGVEEHEGDTRQRGGNRERADRQKKVCNIFKGEKERKTPLRLANAHKCMYIHITLYRGVVAVYCTFFYIY